MKSEPYCFVINKQKNIFKKKTIFSGYWCLNNYLEFINFKKKKNYFIINDVWVKSNKIKNDYLYLNKLIKIYSKKIAIYLNEFHNINNSQKYWNTLIAPWLLYYLSSLLYRWRVVEKALLISNNNLFFYKNTKTENNLTATNSTADFEQLSRFNETFNYILYEKILLFIKKNKKVSFKIKKIKLNSITNNEKVTFFDNIKLNIFKLLDNLIFFFLKKNKFFLELDTFSIINYIKINFKIKQLSIPPFSYFNKINEIKLLNNKYNFIKRKKIKFEKNKKNNLFETFLDSEIVFDIPKCYLENYINLKTYVKKINLFPKIILSSYRYWHNEIFKIWVAELKSNKKTKFISAEHGGGEQNKFNGGLRISKFFADKRIIWIKTNYKNEYQLPPLNINTKTNQILNLKKRDCLLYVPSPEIPFVNRICANINSFSNIENILEFKNKLNVNIFEKIKYLPAELNLKIEMNDLVKILKKNFICKRRQLSKYLPFSKLTICTYTDTAFIQSLLNGPTILLTKDFLCFNNNDILSRFEKNKIVFKNASDAAKHINNIWNDPLDWWKSSCVKKSVKEFLDNSISLHNNKIHKWSNFLQREIKSY